MGWTLKEEEKAEQKLNWKKTEEIHMKKRLKN